MTLPTEGVLEVLKAADFLELKGLVEACCHYIAFLLTQNSLEENRWMFAQGDDLPDEQKEEIQAENALISKL